MNASDAAAPDAAAPDLAVRDAGREAGTPDLAVSDGEIADLINGDGIDAAGRALGFAHADTLSIGSSNAHGYYWLPGDFNGDARTDFLIEIAAAGDFGALNGWETAFTDGSGKFKNEPFMMWKGYPPGGTIADFNGDKRADVLISNADNGTLIELGNGDGTFTASPIDGANGLTVAADIDGDGKIDFVRTGVQNGAPVLQVFLNAGGGKFAQKGQLTSVQGVVVLASGDFNADNRLDILSLVNTNNSYYMQVLLGNGDGTFMAVPGKTKSASAPCVVVGDFNSDHVSDVVTPAGVFLGNGDGTFGAILPEGLNRCPAVGDYDGDGRLDLAVPAKKGFAVWQGRGDGTFGTPLAFPLLQIDPDSIFTVDLDGDGKPDIATSGQSGEGSAIDLFLNTTK